VEVFVPLISDSVQLSELVAALLENKHRNKLFYSDGFISILAVIQWNLEPVVGFGTETLVLVSETRVWVGVWTL
jgi:hypothetical protein